MARMHLSPPGSRKLSLAAVVAALALAAAITVFCWSLRALASPSDVIMVYLAGAVIFAARGGLPAALLYSLASVAAFNYFFIEPLYTFNVENSSYWLTFAVMLFASAIISTQAAGLRDRVALAEMRERQAKALNDLRIRNSLLGAISHDLKTPLAAMMGAADTLLQTPAPTARTPEERALLAGISTESRRFAKIIANLLDIARMTEGAVTLKPSAYDPAELIGSAMMSCKASLQGRSVTIDAPPSLPMILVDGLLVAQVLQNLIDNACRHTQVGTAVHVSACVTRAGFEFQVRDTGGGLSPGTENTLFMAPDAVDGTSAARLGLSICRAIALAHGGNMQARNNPEGGACFIFTLPRSVIVENTDTAP